MSMPIDSANKLQAAETSAQAALAIAAQHTAAQSAVTHGGADMQKESIAAGDGLNAVSDLSQFQIKIDDINRRLQLKAVSVEFQIDPDYKDVILKVVDQQDGKVILQIPSEEVVRVSKVMDQLKGVLLEKTA